MTRFDNPKNILGLQPRPLHSPWGRVDGGTILADGIVSVYTASHGGLYVTTERLAEMPPRFQGLNHYGGGNWFEEDCEWAIVCLAFPEVFRPEECEAARATARHYYPALLAELDAIANVFEGMETP
jgi:hypothetical protein